MPHWIGKYLHDTHSATYNNVAYMVQVYMDNHWPSVQHQQGMTLTDFNDRLVQLNQHLMTYIDQSMMDPITLLTDLSLKIQSCQQQYNTRDSFLSKMMIPFQRDCREMKTRRFLTNGLVNDKLKSHFLVNYLTSMRKDMITQMNDRLMDLAQLIYDDVNDDYVDY
jgi:hypothetical protein